MIDYIAAVYSLLATDAELLSMSARIENEDTIDGELEINSEPVLVISTPHDQAPQNTFSEKLRTTAMRVRIYAKPEGSTLVLDTAAERVRTLFEDWPRSSITGGELIHADVDGPVSAPTDDANISGRIVTVRLLLKES